ncbi:MAG: phospho-N-acetylmuramoyl-pentapeptide-transferase [Armatimonadetes bacterium]|nr:phospho-N-acetylmuramoyl-pentapeptide-transferase [Armatimonadota bacterium]
MAANPLLGAGLFALAMAVSGLLTELVRRRMIASGLGQQVRDDGPQSHLAKAGTPSMGGLGFLGALTLLTVWLYVWQPVPIGTTVALALMLSLAYGAIGFADDYTKLRFRRALGLKARVRLPLELALGGLYAWLLAVSGSVTDAGPAQLIAFGNGPIWIAFCMLVVAGAGNAVNLTDGLDGLAGGTGLFCALGLGAACALLGRFDLAFWSVALAGCLAGFLWLNAHPASIWMGDVGSLGLGAALAAIAVAARLELLLALFGLIFVVEALSVMVQVVYFRLTGGRRVFRMAPYHHHLELGGLRETQIVTRFWLLGLLLAFLGTGTVAALLR